VGAGPAGLTAAAEANRLGHRVTLFEKKNILGGQIRYAQIPPHKEIYGQWIDWLIGQVRKTGVAIKSETEVDEALLKEGKPDAVILATGGEKLVPPIPGIDGAKVCDAWQILDGRIAPGENIVIIGGALIGMETADFLTERGKTVTILEMLKRSPVLKITSHGYMLHKRLRDRACKLLFGARVTAVDETGVTFNAEGQTAVISPVDQVVVAAGMKPSNALEAVCTKLGIAFKTVGDASSPRRIIEATDEGARAAWEL
jgi:pyruvate/2-oxoglutarate dehydrogenase complex dihydrolipoamide dehydrogenase (E3) component